MRQPAPAAAGQLGELVFPLGPLLARCSRCDGTVFRLVQAGSLRLTSRSERVLVRGAGHIVHYTAASGSWTMTATMVS